MSARLLRLAVLVVALACADGAGAPDTRPPNVVIFLADDLGVGDVGFLGSELATPTLDRLAREGVVLETCYAQPVCSATRAALLTGRCPIRYGFQVGVVRPWSRAGLPAEERLLPELLRSAGYATHLVGKWHLGCATPDQLPTARGFDSHYGCYTGLIDHFTHVREGGLDWHRDGAPAREVGYSTTLLRDEAVRIVRAHDPRRPLFLLVAFNAPHYPLQAPDAAVRRLASIADPARRTYAAMVALLDEAVGDVLAALADAGELDDTLVLFLSDNGALEDRGGSNGGLRGQKADLYEGGIRVPALAVWPRKLRGGRRIATPVHVVDWFPTLAALAGVAPDADTLLDGADLGPLLVEERPLPERTLLLDTQRKHGAVRRGRWKLVVDHHARAAVRVEEGSALGVELYDLESDPREERDVAAEHPAVRDALLAELLEQHDRRAPPFEDRGPRPDGWSPPAVYGPAR